MSSLLQDFDDLSHLNGPPQLQQQQSMTAQNNQSSNNLSQGQVNDQPTQQNDQTSIRLSSSRIRRKQYVAIIILSLIGAEFGQDINSNQNQTPYKTIPQGFSLEDHSILKRISNLYFYLETKKCLFKLSFFNFNFKVLLCQI